VQTEERSGEGIEVLRDRQRLADQLGLPLNEQSRHGAPLDEHGGAILRTVEARAIEGAPQ
jgi:hypothetical protein